jgi:glycerol kinase
LTALVLGVDQGTSSTRCLALDRGLTVRGSGSVAVGASFPGPGLVEQDPGELSASASSAIAAALSAAAAAPGEVAALGIANQTETFIVAERESGRAIHPAIVWQDRRTTDRCAALKSAGHAGLIRERTGLELDPTFPATKIGWLLDNIAGARAAARAGELVYLDVAGWLIRAMTGAELCEAGNAGRTLLCAIGGTGWDEELLDVFGVPRAMLPSIVDSDAVGAAVGARLDAGPADGGLPVVAALGDQQASLFGLGCRRRGTAKVTLGTGAFILAQAGTAPPRPPAGVLGSCAWRLGGEGSYALEGFVPAAGAALDWFAGIGVIPPAGELDHLLAQAGPENGDVACVPALHGLGTPSWDAGIRASLFGISRATTRAQLARAVVDGVLHQVADALAAIATEMPLGSVLLDGGMSRSDWVVQRLADLTGIEVRRASRSEATAIGAAMLAGLASGFWESVDEFAEVGTDLVAVPSIGDAERAWLRERWEAAVAVAERWR